MANKYCDHSAYKLAASVVAQVTSTTIVISAVNSGVVAIGATVLFAGADLTHAIFISGFTSGTYGGAGTYTIQNTAGITIAAGATVSLTDGYGHNDVLSGEWGLPQDGDGTVSTRSTASATVSIPLSAYTADAGDTIMIGGATLTCVASGATTNQFNAGTGTTLIDNIVAAINRSTNTVTCSAAAAGWYTNNKLQDVVFARRTSNNLDIMTRAGSTSYNSNASWKVTTAGLTGGSQIDAMFTGGVSGCWGYLTNFSTTIFKSAQAAAGYGVWGSTNIALAGVITPGDTVKCRSGINILFNAPANNAISPIVAGTQLAYVTFLIDDSTVWSDGTDPVIICYSRSPSTQVKTVLGGGFLNFLAKRYSSGVCSLQFREYTTITNCAIRIRANAVTHSNSTFRGIELNIPSGGANVGVNEHSTSAIPNVFEDCNFKHNKGNNFIANNSNSNSPLKFINCIFDNLTNTSLHTGIISLQGSTAGIAELVNCKFNNFIIGSKIVGSISSGSVYISCTNCVFNNVTHRGPYSIAVVTNYGYIQNRMIVVSQQFGARDFSLETPLGFYEWNSSRVFPTLNARMKDGVTPWSIRMIPTANANPLVLTRHASVFKSPKIFKNNTLSTSTRTIKAEFAIDSALTWDSSNVSLEVSYEDSTGCKIISSVTLDSVTSALSASTATWSLESGGQVTFNDGGLIYYNKYKIEITTPTALLINTEVAMQLCIHSVVPDISKAIFLDPEIVIS